MEEVSVRMPYEAHDMDQMSEEEILACLVAETEPKFTVRPTASVPSDCRATVTHISSFKQY